MRKNIRFIVLGLILAFLSSFSYAADDSFYGVRSKTRAYIGAEDETNGEARMAKATTGGYIITSPTPSATSYVNITTSTDTDVGQTATYIYRIIIGVGDATSSITLYDDADGTCSSNKIATIDTATAGVVGVGLLTSVGFCVTSTNVDTGDITVIYK